MVPKVSDIVLPRCSGKCQEGIAEEWNDNGVAIHVKTGGDNGIAIHV